jgi:hypothetical protein
MKGKKFTDEQIVKVLKESEAGEDGGSVPQARDLAGDVLQLEGEVRRDDRIGRAPAEGPRGREREAEGAARGGPGAVGEAPDRGLQPRAVPRRGARQRYFGLLAPVHGGPYVPCGATPVRGASHPLRRSSRPRDGQVHLHDHGAFSTHAPDGRAARTANAARGTRTMVPIVPRAGVADVSRQATPTARPVVAAAGARAVARCPSRPRSQRTARVSSVRARSSS